MAKLPNMRLTVKCDEHHFRPMCVLCIHLADEAFPFFIGWNEITWPGGHPVAFCNRCKALREAEPPEFAKEMVPVCDTCFLSVKEREEMKEARAKT